MLSLNWRGIKFTYFQKLNDQIQFKSIRTKLSLTENMGTKKMNFSKKKKKLKFSMSNGTVSQKKKTPRTCLNENCMLLRS